MNEKAREYKTFLEKVRNSLFEEKEFSVMAYPDGRTLFKILLDKKTQFTAEIPKAKKLGERKTILLFNHLFKNEMVKGNISMEEIMHDALPKAGLENFFKPSQESIYKDPPIGKHGGYLIFEKCYPLTLKLKDFGREENISGRYKVQNTKKENVDSKGRSCLVLYMKSTR